MKRRARRVRVRASFVADLRGQLRWLERLARAEWIDGLRAGLRDARHLLARFPAAGSTEPSGPFAGLRKLILRRVPFVVWYVDDGDSVWLLRLFHARQQRPLR